MEIKNKQTVTRGEGGGGQWGKEGEGSSQGACIKDPWTWTMGCGLTIGAGGKGGAGEKKLKNNIVIYLIYAKIFREKCTNIFNFL